MKKNLPHTQLKLEDVVLQTLRNRDQVSIDDISDALSSYVSSHSLAREVVLKLIEDGKARFNDDWLVEAQEV